MSKDLKRTIAFLFFLLAGIILGTVIARLCAGVPVLAWLGWGGQVGFDPVTLNLIVFKLTFGFSMDVNVAQIICVIASILLYGKTCKGL